MSKLVLSDTAEDVFVKMSEGNPGALRVCLEIYTLDPEIDPGSSMPGLFPLLRLDAMEIYGSEIWMLYKDVCGCDVVHLLALLRANQLGHIDASQIRFAIKGQHEFDLEAILENVRKELPSFASIHTT